MRATKLNLATIFLAFHCSVITQSFAQEAKIKPTVSQWIKPSEIGLFECQVIIPADIGHPVGLSNARVEITGPNALKAVATTDEHGVAKIPGITPGDYTLTVWAEGYIGWQALHFLAQDDERFGAVPSQALVSPAMIAVDLFEKMATPYVRSIPNYEPQDAEVAIQSSLHEVKGAALPEVVMTNGGLDGKLVASNTTDARLNSLEDSNVVENHLVFLIDDQDRVRQTVTDEEGQFYLENLSSGLYSVIIVGRGGIGASRITLIDPKATATSQITTVDGKRFVSAIELEEEFTMEISLDYDECGMPLTADGAILPLLGSSSGGTSNLIGTSLLGAAAVIGTSAYTTSTADSESTDPGGI